MKIYFLFFFIFGSICAKNILDDQRSKLFSNLKLQLKLSDAELQRVKEIFSKNPFMGQGNPQTTVHPMTREGCRSKTNIESNPQFEKICKSPHMAPLYNPKTDKINDAKVCIDQFEFPNIPCEYPVTWVRISEAVQICNSIGKRLCDAHEWEGACAGELGPPDYRFDLLKAGMTINQMQNILRAAHNKNRKMIWSYGEKQINYKESKNLCATDSSKSKECDQAISIGKNVYASCGTNTYPAGAFPLCKSQLEVYDIHGNAAEHMNLPLSEKEMTKNGGTGVTEMKGSWFIFSKIKAHDDDCRWRAPFWHGGKVMDKSSHYNYHLGFRCCKDISKN